MSERPVEMAGALGEVLPTSAVRLRVLLHRDAHPTADSAHHALALRQARMRTGGTKAQEPR